MPRVLIQETFEVFTAILCISSGIPLVAGQVRAASVEATLPEILARGWGFVLLFGATLTLTGLIVANTHQGRNVLQRLIFGHKIERLGLLALSWAGAIYGFSILLAVGLGGVVAAAIIFIFSLTCLTRAFVLATGATMLHRALVSAAIDLEAD